MLERHATTELYESLAAYTGRMLRAHSEFAEAMAAARRTLSECQELIAGADAILARTGVLIVAQESPARRFTMCNTPGRTQREIDELNRRFAASMRKLRPCDRDALAEWIAGCMVVYPNF